ncbi:hypothetical protein KI387_020324 [Taxus chinensis]|uniref:Nucleotide-diphospho-sugar transferase domain-containing protein n=1 Tax=Taxus chinensis TaxID=29808 RepID=A0AA38GBS9_TAXCH|nr:hypothetical protein KI387_020324 [Taxus chinensis]
MLTPCQIKLHGLDRTKMKDGAGASFSFKHQAMQVGLWFTWLAGFLLIGLSLYATQLLPSLTETDQWKGMDVRGISVTIFAAAGPFVGSVGARQAMAVRSWLALASDLQVVLFGQQPSVLSYVETFNHPRVTVDSTIDFTFLGTPMFHCMVARARASNSDIAVLIEPEFVLLPDFMDALQYVHGLEHDWLLVAMSPKASYFPFYIEDPGQWVEQGGLPVEHEKVQQYVMRKRKWANCKGGKLWAWNTGELPLHAGVMPPFIYGQGFHNEWLLNEALSSDFRFVFDASEAISIFHPKNGMTMNEHFIESVDNTNKVGRVWEIEGNTQLATLYGSFYFRPANFSNNPVKLVKCDGMYSFINPLDEPKSGQTINLQLFPSEINSARESSERQIKNGKLMTSFRRFFLGKRQRKPSVRLGQSLPQGTGKSDVWKDKILGSRMKRRLVDCIYRSNSEGRKLDCPTSNLKSVLKPAITLSLPFSLETLLQKVTDNEKTVILAVVGNNYRDMLMSWVCRLRRLKISNFLIFAIDHQIYQFSVLQGLPVVMDAHAMNVSFNDCHFGTKCFQRVTKVKSRIVLQILRLGYHVIFSDVDVYWFKNPLPYLKSFGPGVLAAQSDEYNETEPLNLPRRLNSGFYFAHPDHATIVAFDKIVKHAAVSDMSEQPSFYDTLCGEGGVYRVGDYLCIEPETNLTVHFLDRNKFPNGAFHDLWEKDNVDDSCKTQGCIILHNNWISGRKRKLERQVSSGLWDYDVSSRMCSQNWQGTKSTSSY